MALRWSFILLIALQLVNRSSLNYNILVAIYLGLCPTCCEKPVPPLKEIYHKFKRFCMIILHKLIFKQAFLGLGWAQVYRSQLGLMP